MATSEEGREEALKKNEQKTPFMFYHNVPSSPSTKHNFFSSHFHFALIPERKINQNVKKSIC
jgi:hypothetical protein